MTAMNETNPESSPSLAGGFTNPEPMTPAIPQSAGAVSQYLEILNGPYYAAESATDAGTLQRNLQRSEFWRRIKLFDGG